MIGTLRGNVLEIHPDFFILEVSGIGYKLRAHPGFISNLTQNTVQLAYVHEHIREDAYDLYGFSSQEELTFFEKLLSVSGVGPKVAMAICASAPLDDLRDRLMQGDVDWLSSIPGIGKKTAQKIVLELKGQLIEFGQVQSEDQEIIDALVSLGYSQNQARQVIKQIPIGSKDSSDRLRIALRFLGK